MSSESYRKYQGDVEYEIWRSGGNPDAVDLDRLRDRFDEGISIEHAAFLESNPTGQRACGSCFQCGIPIHTFEEEQSGICKLCASE